MLLVLLVLRLIVVAAEATVIVIGSGYLVQRSQAHYVVTSRIKVVLVAQVLVLACKVDVLLVVGG